MAGFWLPTALVASVIGTVAPNEQWTLHAVWGVQKEIQYCLNGSFINREQQDFIRSQVKENWMTFVNIHDIEARMTQAASQNIAKIEWGKCLYLVLWEGWEYGQRFIDVVIPDSGQPATRIYLQR